MFFILVMTLLWPIADFPSGKVSQIDEVILSLLANDDCFNGGSELLEDESRSHQSEKYHLDEGSVVDAGLAQVWSITQFYFVGLLQLKERCKKCVIQIKHTIKGCVCCL